MREKKKVSETYSEFFFMFLKDIWKTSLKLNKTAFICSKIQYVFVMAELKFQHHYSRLQCYLILPKSF